MSLIERFRAAATPPDAAQLDERARADLNAAIDAIARRRLYAAVREVDAAIASVRAMGLALVSCRSPARRP